MKNDKIKSIFNSTLLFVLAFSIPFYNLSIINRSPIFFIFIFFLVIFSTGFMNVKKKYPLELVILLFLCLYKIFSIIWSIDPAHTKEVVFNTSIPLLVMTFFFYNLIKDINDLNFLFKIYIFACFIFSLFVFSAYSSRPENFILNLSNSQITFLDTNPTEVSFFMLYGIIFLIYFESYKKINNIFISLLILTFITTILLSGSRTGFANLILIIFYIFFIKRSLFWFLSTLLFVFIIFYFISNLLSSEVISRYSNIINIFSKDHPSFYQEGYRGWNWITGLSLFFDKGLFYQIFGIGYEVYGTLIQEGVGRGSSHHNQMLGYFVELGIIGLVINLILFTKIFKKVFIISKYYSSNFFLFLIPTYSYLFFTGFDAKFFFYFFIIIMIKLHKFSIIEKN